MTGGAAFLGSGWSLPIVAPDGAIARAEHEESIRQAIWTILATAKGERVMRPDFGCGIHELVFAGHAAATAGAVEAEVRTALVRWEPRIDLVGVEAGPSPNEAATLLIAVRYLVRATNSRFNLVYPFYLERGLV